MKILLMGPIGSGKGTQGEYLSKKLNLPLISVGQTLRELTPDSPYYERIKKNVNEGLLAPEDLVALILKEKVASPEFCNGFIFDGWGRTMDNLKYYDPDFDLVINIKIQEDTTIKRISSRRTCSECGKVYNLVSLPPKVEGICDIDGAPLLQRTDDKPEAIKKRMEIYNTETREVLAHFRKQGKLVEVDGEGTPEEVFNAIVKALGI